MRPSWPAPTMPTVMSAELRKERAQVMGIVARPLPSERIGGGRSRCPSSGHAPGVGILQHVRGLLLAECIECGSDGGMLVAENRGGSERGVGCARGADGKCRDRNAGRHLH